MKNINKQDYIEMGHLFDLEPELIEAVAKIESNGNGFNTDGTPKTLFEGHIFYRLTKGKFGISNISYPKWTKKYYATTAQGEKQRLEKACALDRENALQSASWGKFQIMGFNYKYCGFKNVQNFVNAMYKNEKEHLKAFLKFCKSKDILKHLKNKNFKAFAYRYNGKFYYKNQYDTKIETLYNSLKQQTK